MNKNLPLGLFPSNLNMEMKLPSDTGIENGYRLTKVSGDLAITVQVFGSVTFDANGGTGSMDAQQISIGDENILNENAFTRTGYSFAGWNTEPDGTGTAYSNLAAVFPESNMTLYAQWQVNTYLITFVNEDGTELQSSEVAYGETPVFSGETPTKAATAQHTYTFAGWSPEIVAVTGAATYTATYTSTVNKYLIKFVDEDGTELQSSEEAYGVTPVFNGETPTKAATAQFTYTFAGWSPEIAPVTGEATYTAGYSSTVNKYVIKFVDEDSTLLQSSEVAYGDTPSFYGDTPVKAPSAQYTYTFAGWTPEITTVTGAATYTATYSQTVNEYTVKFVNEDGTELQSSKVAYGETPAYTGEIPTKAATAQYTYTFTGWSPEITPVTGNATYTATYSSAVNEYTIKFLNEDGTELQSSKVAYGETPAYTGETPTKAATAQYTYTFAGWTPDIAAVTGAATYTATYSQTINAYTVTFLDEDGETVLGTASAVYGTAWADVEKPADPTKTGYTFNGWSGAPETITGDVSVTARFNIRFQQVHCQVLERGRHRSSVS